MTKTGTDGYVAPEILKGESYGPAADIFSFGILIAATLVTGGNIYSEMRSKGVEWQVISHMITSEGYRPLLPEFSDTCAQGRLSRLASECWDDKPRNRPSASVVVVVIQSIIDAYAGSSQGSIQNVHTTSKNERYTANCTEFAQRAYHNLWSMTGAQELKEVPFESYDVDHSNFSFIREDMTGASTDPVIDGILAGTKGSELFTLLGSIVFFPEKASGNEVHIVPEPFAETNDIIISSTCKRQVAIRIS